MKRNLAILFAISLILSLTSNCVVKSIMAGSEEFAFSESDFSVVIPLPRTEALVTKEEDGTRAFEFQQKVKDQLKSMVRITIRVMKSDDALFAPGYEATMIRACECTISKRGVIHVGDLTAREYVVSMKGGTWSGYQRHIASGNKIAIIQASTSVDSEPRLEKMYKTLTDSFVFPAP